MKFKTAKEAYRDTELCHRIKEEEQDSGVDYNWIVANHFSLTEYLVNNNISLEEAFKRNVICRVTVFADKQKQHLLKSCKEGMLKRMVFTDTLYYGRHSKQLIFRDNDRRSVPLLYLILAAFSLNKQLIYQTRLYDELNQGESSHSIKRIKKNRPLIEDNLRDIIDASFYCKGNCFLQPIINDDGTPVTWFIPMGTLEENRDNAIRMQSKQQKESFIEESVVEDIVFDQDVSDQEIKNAIRKNCKKKTSPQ